MFTLVLETIYFMGEKRESLVRGTWAQTQTSSSLSHHPRSCRQPHESHRCIQGLGHECMLIKPGNKFPFWPGFNQDGFGVFAVVLLLLLFLFFFLAASPQFRTENSLPCLLNTEVLYYIFPALIPVW